VQEHALPAKSGDLATSSNFCTPRAEIRRAIADGEAQPGERLPPARDLAVVLAVNTNTVLRALRILRDEGLLEFRRGRGITVTGSPERGAVTARGLTRCGFALDPNDVLASNPLWRMPGSQWAEVFRACLDSPDRSHLIRANVAFDFRQVAGALDVTPTLVAVLREAKEHPDFLGRLARTATDFKPPLGFRGALVVHAKDTTPGIDLKQGGAIPITNLARFFALSNGITISSTADRLAAVKDAGALDKETAEALREALEIVMRLRLEHHAAQIEAGAERDNIIDPAGLPPLARAQLREAFRAVAHAQKQLSVYVPLGL
jgi:CBS domain-containing protein